ncbi:hypothetical protein C8233_04830 [Halomonas sp. SF2003]|nr:hypothetical protein C8233_04830 [Halomonas sp. SF2003]
MRMNTDRARWLGAVHQAQDSNHLVNAKLLFSIDLSLKQGTTDSFCTYERVRLAAKHSKESLHLQRDLVGIERQSPGDHCLANQDSHP